MPLPHYTIACTRKELIAKDTYEIAFTKPEGFTYKTGQFILLAVPLVSNPEDTQPRAYSLASSPDELELLLLVTLKPGGRTSTWIEQALKVGTTIQMQGPFGPFTLPSVSDADYLLLATGAGLAPFRGHVRELLARNEQVKIDLVFGCRTEESLFWIDHFEQLARNHERFSFHPSLTRAGDSWTGHKGRIQTLVPSLIRDAGLRHIFVCGNPEMTKEVKSIALETWGVPKAHLHVEGFI